MSAPVPKRPMTLNEIALVGALARCRFPPASFSKRFARDLEWQMRNGAEISEKQAECLRKQVTRFRRQIAPTELPESERHLLAAKPTPIPRLVCPDGGGRCDPRCELIEDCPGPVPNPARGGEGEPTP